MFEGRCSLLMWVEVNNSNAQGGGPYRKPGPAIHPHLFAPWPARDHHQQQKEQTVNYYPGAQETARAINHGRFAKPLRPGDGVPNLLHLIVIVCLKRGCFKEKASPLAYRVLA